MRVLLDFQLSLFDGREISAHLENTIRMKWNDRTSQDTAVNADLHQRVDFP